MIEKKRFRKVSVEEFLKSSSCEAKAYYSPIGEVESLFIQFKGPLSRIPSLKNSKIQGTNILRSKERNHLRAMTLIVGKCFQHRMPVFPEYTPLFLLVEAGRRGVSFDEDNTLTTVKDWLEPRYIRKKDREWGIGIVRNDSLVHGFAVKTNEVDITNIYIVKKEHVETLKQCFLAGVKKAVFSF